jgi:hypothetical protein
MRKIRISVEEIHNIQKRDKIFQNCIFHVPRNANSSMNSFVLDSDHNPVCSRSEYGSRAASVSSQVISWNRSSRSESPFDGEIETINRPNL